MAQEIVGRFWSINEATIAREQFEALFQNKDYSQAEQIELPQGFENPVWIVELLKALGAIKTSSDAKRLLESGAVHVNDAKITDFKATVTWQPGDIIKVGKHRIYKIK
jgi:tyrosyl-tRNA synthetase